jgi:hypothetical protein
MEALRKIVDCDKMARAWRNRSNCTQAEWLDAAREIKPGVSTSEIMAYAAMLYATCRDYAIDGIFDGRKLDTDDLARIGRMAEGVIRVAAMNIEQKILANTQEHSFTVTIERKHKAADSELAPALYVKDQLIKDFQRFCPNMVVLVSAIVCGDEIATIKFTRRFPTRWQNRAKMVFSTRLHSYMKFYSIAGRVKVK